jgi:hypothetical protein
MHVFNYPNYFISLFLSYLLMIVVRLVGIGPQINVSQLDDFLFLIFLM